MIPTLSEEQIAFIQAELERRKTLLDRRLESIEVKKRAKRKGAGAVQESATQDVSTEGTRITLRTRRGRPPKPVKTPTNDAAIAAARKLGATDDMLRQMGLL